MFEKENSIYDLIAFMGRLGVISDSVSFIPYRDICAFCVRFGVPMEYGPSEAKI